MDLANQKPQSVYINCGNLDMRDTTEETAAKIKHVNAGNVMVTARTRSFLSSFSVNMGNVVEIPEGAQLVMSDEILGHADFTSESAPKPLVNMANIILKSDVTSEDVDQGWSEIVNLGAIIYPDHLGEVAGKITDNKGTLISYNASAQLIAGDVTLDEAFLQSLDDQAVLAVTGSLRAPNVLPDQLIEQKIQSVHAIGHVVCHEENKHSLTTRFDMRGGTPEIMVIPAGYELIERILTLDTHVLQAWADRKVYCTERVLIQPDVDPELIDRALAGLISGDMVFCPSSISAVFTKKCDTLTTTVYFYDGIPLVVDSTMTLRNTFFEFMEGNTALLVNGAFKIDSEVDPRHLYERLTGVYNWGAISCSSEQLGAVEARVVLNEGAISDITSMEEEQDEAVEEEEGVLKINSGNFKL